MESDEEQPGRGQYQVQGLFGAIADERLCDGGNSRRGGHDVNEGYTLDWRVSNERMNQGYQMELEREKVTLGGDGGIIKDAEKWRCRGWPRLLQYGLMARQFRLLLLLQLTGIMLIVAASDKRQ